MFRIRQVNRRSIAIAIAVLLAGPVAVAAQEGEQPDTVRAPIQLSEVVVTASGFEQHRLDAPASVTVVTAEKLNTQRNSSLAEMLADVESIDIGGSVGKTGGLNISVRGMPSDYTLVLIDGRRQNTAGSVTPNGFGETSTGFFPPANAIERIEVIRGPMATLYGSDAMGGVINIITRKPGEQWRGSFSSDATLQQETEFGNTYNGTLSLSGPLVQDRLALSLRGSLLHRRPSELTPTGDFGENTTISRRGPSPTEADIYSVGGRLTFTPVDDHTIWFEADRSHQRYDNRDAQLGTLDNPDGDPPTFNGYGPEQKFLRDQAALAHTWTLRGAQLVSSLMRNTTETIGRTLPTGTPGGPPGSGAPNKTPGAPRTLESTNTVFDSKLVTSLPGHTVTLGGQYWDAGMIDGVALEPFAFQQWSLFAEDEWRFIPTMGLTVGGRWDDHSTFGGQVSPRGYLVWNATPQWTVKGGVSRGYKTPRVEQLVDGIIGFTGQGRNAVIGTPSLKPEKSTSTDVGVYYQAANGLTVGVGGFYNQFTDKITRGTPVPNCSFAGAPDLPGCLNYGDFPAQESFSQSVNVDEAVTQGVEASASVPLLDRYFVSANYTFTETEQKSGESAGMPLSNTPKHMVNLNVRAQATDRLNTWLRGEYRSKRARRTSAGENLAYEALGDYKPYSLFHLGAGYEVLPGVSVNATIYNLFDKDFREYGEYQGTPTADNPSGVLYTNLYNVHQEGRRLWLSTTVSF